MYLTNHLTLITWYPTSYPATQPYTSLATIEKCLQLLIASETTPISNLDHLLGRHLQRLQQSTGKPTDVLIQPMEAFATLAVTSDDDLLVARTEYEACSELIGEILAKSRNRALYAVAARSREGFEGVRVESKNNRQFVVGDIADVEQVSVKIGADKRPVSVLGAEPGSAQQPHSGGMVHEGVATGEQVDLADVGGISVMRAWARVEMRKEFVLQAQVRREMAKLERRMDELPL